MSAPTRSSVTAPGPAGAWAGYGGVRPADSADALTRVPDAEAGPDAARAADEAADPASRPQRAGFPHPDQRSTAHTAGAPTAGRPPADHRRPRSRPLTAPSATLLFVGLSAVVTAVSVLAAVVSYGPLRNLVREACPTCGRLAPVWPLLVYGPWSLASLSVLQCAVYRRRAAPSWAASVLIALIAALLCVAGAPRTWPAAAVSGLPPVTALLCFHQLIEQIALTRTAPRRLAQRRGSRRRA